MSNVATVKKEVRMLKEALAPKKEPEWVARAAAIDKSLREYAAIKEGSGFNSLTPREQAECEMNGAKDAIRGLARQGLWGPEVAAKYEEGKQE